MSEGFFQRLPRRTTGRLAGSKAALLLALVALVGCAESPQTVAALALNRGLTALQEGGYAEAREACMEAAGFDQQNRSALLCWFSASVELGDWHSASEALAAARLVWPDDDWLRALSADVAYRQTGQGQEISPESHALAWACAGGACTPAPPSESQLSGTELEAAALVRMGEQMWTEAAALLEASCHEAGCRDLLLMAWLKMNRFERISEWLSANPCGSADTTAFAEELRRFLWPEKPTCSASDSPLNALGAPSDEAHRILAKATRLEVGREERLALLESACALEPKWAIAHLLTGSELLLRGEPLRARTYLEKTLDIAPDRSWAWLLLSLSDVLAYGRYGRSLELASTEGGLPPNWRKWLESLVR